MVWSKFRHFDFRVDLFLKLYYFPLSLINLKFVFKTNKLFFSNIYFSFLFLIQKSINKLLIKPYNSFDRVSFAYRIDVLFQVWVKYRIA